MKLVIGTALVLLLAGAPGYARQEPDKDKPKEEPKKQEAPKKGEEPKKAEAPKEQPIRARQEQEKPAEKPKAEPARQENDRNKAQQTDRAQEQERARQTEQHNAQQQHPVEQHQAAEHTGHDNSRRIPEEKFRASFGSSHHFHVERSNDRRFNYGGYYFTYSEPWPGDWAYTDDVYIDYIDGEYYLIDPRHPGVRLLVVIAG